MMKHIAINLLSAARRTSAMLAIGLCMMYAPHADAQEVSDPIEPVNRAIFGFNEYADRYFLKPAAQAYGYVLPEEGEQAISNVLRNLEMPVYFANSVLQGDPQNAFSSLWTFLLNSTFGVAGIFDFAGAATDLKVNREDFGQTLGVWGVGEGPYLVLPLFGPSNIRDTAGFGVDFFFDPTFNVDDDGFIITRATLMVLSIRHQNLGTLEQLYETSLDPYATFRSAYTQRRRAMIENRNTQTIDQKRFATDDDES